MPEEAAEVQDGSRFQPLAGEALPPILAQRRRRFVAHLEGSLDRMFAVRSNGQFAVTGPEDLKLITGLVRIDLGA